MNLRTNRPVTEMVISVDSLHMERTIQEDHDEFCALLLDPTVTKMNGRRVDVETLFQRYLKNIYSFSVFSDDSFVGLCSLFPTSLSSAFKSIKSLELVYSVVPLYWNKGVATYSVNRICELGFNEIGLDCILSGCYTDNIPSSIVLRKTGFKEIFTREEKISGSNRMESIYLKTGL